MAIFWPMSRLSREDFPTLGRPTMAINAERSLGMVISSIGCIPFFTAQGRRRSPTASPLGCPPSGERHLFSQIFLFVPFPTIQSLFQPCGSQENKPCCYHQGNHQQDHFPRMSQHVPQKLPQLRPEQNHNSTNRAARALSSTAPAARSLTKPIYRLRFFD